MLQDVPGLREVVQNCALVSADGQSVVWAGRFLGIPVPQRVAGIFQERVKRSEAGRMVNTTRRLALMYDLPLALEVSTDPSDDYLLSLAAASGADYLVTGDKSHLLPLDRRGATHIVTARELIQRLAHAVSR